MTLLEAARNEAARRSCVILKSLCSGPIKNHFCLNFRECEETGHIANFRNPELRRHMADEG